MRKYFLPTVLLVLLLMPPVLASGNVKIKDFSANATNGTIPLHTRFIGDVTGNVTSWRGIFENIGTGATTYSGSNITTHHNFGKPGIYNVTLNVWGSDGNDTLTKTGYITAMTASTETAIKNKTTESVSTNAKAKKETTESVGTNTKTKKETTELASIPMNPNWGLKDKQHYLNGYNEGYTIGVINGYNRGYDLGIKGLKYIRTVHINFAPKSTTSQDIGYAGGYNTGGSVAKNPF
jgi:PKD repeat protein